jgi:hypothetical protein
MPAAGLFIGSTLILNVAATVPTYNIKPTCRAAVAMVGGGRTVAMCEAGEAQARDELVKEWPTFTEPTKDRCLKTMGKHAPSYIELIICLQQNRDQQKRQEQEKASAGRPKSR